MSTLTIEQFAPLTCEMANLKITSPADENDNTIVEKKVLKLPSPSMEIEDQLETPMTSKEWKRFMLCNSPPEAPESLMSHSASGLATHHSLMAKFTGGTPGKLYIIPIDWSVMRQKMARLKLDLSDAEPIESIYPGAPCVAVVKGQQYRAEVVDQFTCKWTQILLVDYGVQLKVLPNCLYSVDCLSEFEEMPALIKEMALSVRCTLADVPDNHKWEEHELELFQEHMSNGGDPVRIQFINQVKVPGITSTAFHDGTQSVVYNNKVDGFAVRVLIKKPDGLFYSLTSEVLGKEQQPVMCSAWADRYLWLGEQIRMSRSAGRNAHIIFIQQLHYLTDYARLTHSIVPPTTQLALDECEVGMPCMYKDRYGVWHRAVVHSFVEDEEGGVFLHSVDDGEYMKCTKEFAPEHLCTLAEQPKLVRESAMFATKAKLESILPTGETFTEREYKKLGTYCPWASYDFNRRFSLVWFNATATGKRSNGRMLIECYNRVAKLASIGGGRLFGWSPKQAAPFGTDIVSRLVESRAKVTYLKHPGAFWLKLHHSQKLENEWLNSINYPVLTLSKAQAVGSVCLTEVEQFNKKDVRALVTEAKEKTATVRLMEYGVTMEKECDQFYSLKNQRQFLSSTFPLAFKCRLANLDLSKEWSRETLNRFYELVAEKELKVNIYKCSEDAEGEMSYQVDLMDEGGNKIGMQLVQEGLATFKKTVMIRM